MAVDRPRHKTPGNLNDGLPVPDHHHDRPVRQAPPAGAQPSRAPTPTGFNGDSPTIQSATGALASYSTASIHAAEANALNGVKNEDERKAIEAKFDLLELQAQNDAINLIISTLSNMMNSNKNTASQVINNLK